MRPRAGAPRKRLVFRAPMPHLPLSPAPMPMPRRLVLFLVLLAGCASTDESRLADPSSYGSGDEVGYALARTAETIRTVQLYRSGDESSLPIVGLQSGQTLTLEFD